MNENFLKEAIEESKFNESNNFKSGGPFGAIVVKDERIIAKGHNTVVESKDPTAHAEINAIRNACLKLGTHDLSNCTLYVNAEPCPMCLSAIIWSNIKTVYYCNSAEEAGKIGFRDDMIYDFLKKEEKDKNILNIIHHEMDEAKQVFKDFENNQDKIMY